MVEATGTAPIAFSLTAGPAGMSVSAAGAVSWTPAAGQEGPHAVEITATNSEGSDVQGFTVDVAAAPPPAVEIIVDNDDPETSSTGNWVLLGEAGSYDGTMRYGAPGQINTYRFTPTVPQSGEYRIYGWWNASGNRSSQVAYDIQHAGGLDTVLVNQKLDGSQWNELGVFTLDVGAGHSVEISDRNGIYAIADAVRFEFIGSIPVADTGQSSLLTSAD